MNTVVCSAIISRSLVFFTLLLVTNNSQTQTIISHLRSTTSQADYVIIAPPQYVSALQPLANFRAARNGISVAIAQTDSIYSQFGQGASRDSAIKRFIHFTLTSWSNLKPQYFLLAGNVNTVPSHKEQGLQFPPPDPSEDSIMVDQWFVEGLPDTVNYPRPVAAIGRFPAFELAGIQAMVTKTIAYETNTDTVRRSRSIVVADYRSLEGNIFEQIAHQTLILRSEAWRETITVHIRQTSPQYRDRNQFRQLWSQGAAVLQFVGLNNSVQFSHSRYFTTFDVDSLATTTLLPLCTFMGDQRFQKADTLAMAVSLLAAPSKGAIATIAPSGWIYSTGIDYFGDRFFSEIRNSPRNTVGKCFLTAKRFFAPNDQVRKYTYLGDPALIIKSSLTTDVNPLQALPDEFVLYQNYPNPFNPKTNISFDLPKSSFVTLKVFDLLGREVATLINEFQDAGFKSVKFDASGLASGVYLYRMSADNFSSTRKLLLMK